MTLSETIKAIRESKNLTQTEVALRLETDRSNYHRLENRGEKLTVEQLQKIATALGLESIIEFFTYGQSGEVKIYPSELREIYAQFLNENAKYDMAKIDLIQAFWGILEWKVPDLKKPQKWFTEETRKQLQVKAFRLALRHEWFFVFVASGIFDSTEFPQHFRDVLKNPDTTKPNMYDGDTPLE